MLASRASSRQGLLAVVSRISTKIMTRKNSSISAMAYKTLHRNTKRPPLPTIETPNWSVDAAISSILTETPAIKPATSGKQKVHILNCLVQNEPGVLSRISGTLAGRGFNIDSLVVSNTEVKDLSRMTIVLHGLDGVIEQARRQLEDLVPVWAVLNYTDAPLVKREILLAKVSLLGPEFFQQLLHHHTQVYHRAVPSSNSNTTHTTTTTQEHHPNNMPSSQALRHKHEHLSDITALAHLFGGKIADISDSNCIVELCAKPERVSNFLQVLQPFGVLELVRTGVTALPRTPFDSAVAEARLAAETDGRLAKSAQDVVDATQLPPG